MKKLIFLSAFLMGGLICQMTHAQVSVRINIGSQPIWGPVGYDHVDYYYIPEIETYYYVPKHRFIYVEGNRWVSRNYLPPRYHNYDLYRGDKVVINEPEPYLRHHEYRAKYSSYHGHHDQIIRDSHEERYFEIKDHPEHNRWREVKRHQKEERRENRHRDHDDHGRR